MKKTKEKLVIIKKSTVLYNSSEITSKKVVWAQSQGSKKYYVWIEDDEEDSEIEIIPLDEVVNHNPNVFKSKQTAENIYEYYLEGLQAVTEDTIEYLFSRNPIPVA